MFKMAPKCSVDMLSVVPKCKKALLYFMETIYMLDTFFKACVMVLLTISPILINQQYIYMVSLDRNT